MLDYMKLAAVTVLVGITGSALSSQTAQAQCTPDVSYTTPGYYPIPLPSPQAGQAYNQTITFVFPSTVDISGIQATIKEVKIDSVVGLPPGITFQCNMTDCTYPVTPTSFRGCAQLSGQVPVNAGGPYEVKLFGTAQVSLLGSPPFPYSQSDTLNLFVKWPAGFSSNTVENGDIRYYNRSLHFENLNILQNAKLEILSISGQKVHSAPVTSNGVIVLPNTLSTGMYIVRLSTGYNTLVRKIVIE